MFLFVSCNGHHRYLPGLTHSCPTRRSADPIDPAHAVCFSLAFSKILGDAGFTPKSIRTEASVHLEQVGEGFAITRIELRSESEIDGIDEGRFQELAEVAKTN